MSADDTIARSMQLLQGQVAQQQHRRRKRKGALWQHCYHSVAVDTKSYLWRCIPSIDLNMVGEDVVRHPAHGRHEGYHEIQFPRSRYCMLDLERLIDFVGVSDLAQLQHLHVEAAQAATSQRTRGPEDVWTEAIAVGPDRSSRPLRHDSE